MWDTTADGGACVAAFSEHEDDVHAMDWCADGSMLASIAKDGFLRMFDPRDPSACAKVPALPVGTVSGCA